MAIAAHKKRSTLVDRLWAYYTDRPTPAQEVVNNRLEELMLEVATQTDPEDWSKANRARVRTLRDSFASYHLDLITSSAHWGTPSHAEAIIAALPNTDPDRIPYRVHTLLALEPTETEQTKARHTILTKLPHADSRALDKLVGPLRRLAPGPRLACGARYQKRLSPPRRQVGPPLVSEEVHAALAHVTRSEILTYLKDKDYIRVGQIAEGLGIPNSTLSGHLTIMKTAGLLVSRQPAPPSRTSSCPYKRSKRSGIVFSRRSRQGCGAWWSPALILKNRMNIIARHNPAGGDVPAGKTR